MEIINQGLGGLFEILPEPHRDTRGFLSKIYDKEIFHKMGLNANFGFNKYFQYSKKKDTIRGLHIQLPPYTETKIIYALEGEVKWVAVDLRKNSPTFGKWSAVDLLEGKGNGLYVSRGFANGAISLTDNARVFIEADQPYIDGYGVGVNWKDKELNIDWGLGGRTPIILERDDNYSSFGEFKIKHEGVVIQ